MADPVLEAALGQPVVTMFGAVRIDLAGIGPMTGPLCLLDGAATVVIDGESYSGSHDIYGTIDSIDAIEETEGEEAPEISLTLNVPQASGSADLVGPAMQGREVRVMVGALDPVSGLVIGQPEIIFLGEIDVPTLSVSQGERTVTFTVISVFERLFEVEDGVRAQDGWHQSIWPGERGFAFMTGIDKNLYWGGKPPTSTSLTLAQRMANIRSSALSNVSWWSR